MTNETKPKKLTKYQKKKQKEENNKKLWEAFEKFRDNPITVKNFFDSNISPLIQKNPDKAKNAVKHFIGHNMTQQKYANVLNTISSNNFTIEDFRKECSTSKLEPEIVILLEAMIATASDAARKALEEEIAEEKRRGGQATSELYEPARKIVIDAWKTGDYKYIYQCADATYIKANISHSTAMSYIRKYKQENKKI